MPTAFTPITALVGGALIGLSAVALMAFTGRIAGVSGIAARLLPPYSDREWAGRFTFVAGLVAAPIMVRVATGSLPPQAIETGGVLLVLAGVLVGFGSVWGSGCTSGHGVCGISRLSLRSIVATLVFMVTGFATTFVIRHLS
ncbi:YeeE/YedE family protein [Bradyrhizobium sp. USDA 10063]